MDKPQDFHKPITIVLTGSGSATVEHIDATFENLILSGLPADGDRYVKVLVPFDEPTSGVGVTNAIQWFTETLPAEELTGVVWTPSKMVSKMKVTIKAEEGIITPLSALEFALKAASGYLNSSEVFFFSFYDPEKETDLEQIRVAKEFAGIRTVNVCLAGTDVFENYESIDETLAREKAEAEFAAQVAEETAKAPKKAVAKKAAVPRKRAAAKVLVAEDIPLLPEPQTAVQSPSEPLPTESLTPGLDVLIEKSVQRETAKRELTADQWDAAELVKHTTMDKLSDEDLAVIRDSGLYTEDEIHDQIAESEAIQAEMLDKMTKQVVGSDKVLVKKEDLLRLLDVLTDIVKGM